MPRGITLKFAVIECDRCAGTRLLTQPCPECGLPPRRHETQPDLDRRRRILAELEAAETAPSTLVPEDLGDAAGEILNSYRA
jgi:hypothetical protein